MSDQGLSIFDHEPDNSADEPTQVINRDGVDAGTQKTAQKPAAQTPAAPAQRSQPATPAPAPARPAAAATPPATPQATPQAAAQPPSLPTVRRGGYDTAAVDKHLRTVTAEKAGLAASLTEAQARLKALQAEVDALRTEIDENQNPTYAGLGGKASEML